MDGKQKKSCKQCGSTVFEEIDALYYCSVCSTQVTGLTIEVSHFDGAVSTLREVRDKTTKRKAADTGPPWTTMEAFNVILAHQCSQLEDKLNLGPQFKCVLFSLWAEYLSKCEVAFTRREQSKPKVNITSHLRDIQLIDQGLEKVTKPLSLTHKSREDLKVGNTKLLRNIIIGDLNRSHSGSPKTGEPENNSLVAHTENLDIADSLDDIDENFEPEEKLNLEMETDLNFNNISDGPADFMYGNDPIDFHANEKKPSLDERSNFSSMLTIGVSEPESLFKSESIESTLEDYNNGLSLKGPRQWKAKYKSKKKEIRNVLETFDKGGNFHDLVNELDAKYGKSSKLTNGDADNSQSEDDEAGFTEEKLPDMTKRSLLIKKIVNKDKNGPAILRNTDDITVERMTIHKTLQFILLVLPEEWILLPGGDVNVLHPRKVVNIEALERNTVTLKKFLFIQNLPHPNFIEMLKRHIFELNLPFQLIDIVANVIDWKVIAKASPQFKIDEKAKIIPCYDVYSFCSIVVVLKKLFILNNEIEFQISDFVRENFHDSFIWKDWLDHTRVLWKLMNHHYLPINPSLALNVFDIEVVRVHRDKISNAMFGIDSSFGSKRYFLTKDFKSNLSSLMGQSFETDSCAIDLPPFTVYHLYEAKCFVRRRLNALNRSSHIFEENFTNKSIDYLFSERYKFVGIEANKLKAHSRAKKIAVETAIEEWPEPLQLLLNLGSFILNRPPKMFAPIINRLDSLVKDLP
uniref:Rrn7/TAF1B C-terminal cyclin domain-containing protein n=1 Tax=Tetranychus urticae TaxID=32264 RepID=T1KZ69_TETUR